MPARRLSLSTKRNAAPKGARKRRSGGGVAYPVDESDPRAVDGDGPRVAAHFKLCANSGLDEKNIKYQIVT
jgi:hypothetical protein